MIRERAGRAVADIRQNVGALRARRALDKLERALRRRHGARFVSTLDARDELMFHIRETYGLSPLEAHARYLRSGELYFDHLARVLGELGRLLPRTTSLLDFACGYGRVTRFLVTALEPSRVTVSDINPDAVDFVRATFGVRGFHSSADPDDVAHDQRYDVVFVVSLFTHLSLAPWRAWLRRLSRMVARDGVLAFTVRAPDEITQLDPGHRAWTKELEDGFRFGAWNETRGRLAGEYYGTTYVTDAFVRRIVVADDLGEVLAQAPMTGLSTQVLYVLRR